MKLALSSIEYTKSNDSPIVHLFARDSELQRYHVRVYGLYPFFYVDRNAIVPKNARIIRVENVTKAGWKSIRDNEIKKIVMKLPEDVGGDRKFKQGFRSRFEVTYEDDVEFITRAAIELGIKSGFELNFKENEEISMDINYEEKRIIPIDFKAELGRLHIDIEVSTVEVNGRVPSYTNPICPIYCISNLNNYTLKFVTFIWHPNYINNKKYETKYKVPFNIEKFKEYLKESYPVSIYTFNNEKDMLKKYIEFVKDVDPDIITGWNVKGFDIPYLLERIKRLRLDVVDLSPLRSVYIDDKKEEGRIKGRIIFDTWRGFVKTLTHERESNKLDMVAKDLFGVGKVQHAGIDEIWDSNRDILIKYNIQDVFLEYAIGVTQNVFNFFYNVKCYSGCHYEDVLSNGRIIDAYMLFKAKDAKIVLPSKVKHGDETSKGAYVLQAPKKGIQNWLCVLDLKSLYPMIMLTLNMGEDTYVFKPKPSEIPNLIKSPIKDVYFRKDKKSFLSKIIDELITYRAELKDLVKKYKKAGEKSKSETFDRIQTVVKFITNSLFGVLGDNRLRLYNRRIFANITAVGRIIIGYSINYCQRLGYVIYYGDTDSIFPCLKERELPKLIDEMNELVTKLNKKYDIFLKIFNVDKHFFLMKGEKLYKTLFMVKLKGEDRTAKKRYAGNIIWEDGECDKLDIKGFDRSDMSRLGNSVMKKILEMACYNKSIQDIENYVKNEIKNIKNNKYTLLELGFSKGIGQSLSSYEGINKNGKKKSAPDWIRGAIWTNEYSGLWNSQTNYSAGSKPKYVYINPKKLPNIYRKTEIAALDENYYLPPNIVNAIDFDIQIEKTIKSKIETILDALGSSWEKATSKYRIKSIMDYGIKKEV